MNAIRKDEYELTAERDLGLEESERLLLRHVPVCFSGPEPDGEVSVKLDGIGLSALREQYPGAELHVVLLRVWEEEVVLPGGETEIVIHTERITSELGWDSLCFSVSCMGCYDILIKIELPEEEAKEPVEADESSDFDESGEPDENIERDNESETWEEPEPSPPVFISLPCAYAPEGFTMLCVTAAPEEGTCWAFDGKELFSMQDGSYRMFVPTVFFADGTLTEEGAKLLAQIPGSAPILSPSYDVNQDGAVNIADANVLFRLISEGSSYYSIDQFSLCQRMFIDIDGDMMYTLADLNAVMDQINGVVWN